MGMTTGHPEASISALVEAVQWAVAALTGSLATAAATLAVASFGYLVFMGQMDLRRAAQVILGCFILFSAPKIAAGLIGLGTLSPNGHVESTLPPSIKLPSLPQPNSHPTHDPYAAAAISQD
ncbi:MAG: TrbC/VirB2 family protein [Polynucleobacter sp.]|nr:TrbC/VirB2 family protein [Polynucleobacter sp.]